MTDTAETTNTDRKLWCDGESGYYANSIHVTKSGGVGIDVGGHVIVKTLSEWHALAAWQCQAQPRAAVPTDCNHPFCGCDPHAERIISALIECGWGPTHKLEAALKWYAAEENNCPGAAMTSHGAHRASAVERDKGERARAALKRHHR